MYRNRIERFSAALVTLAWIKIALDELLDVVASLLLLDREKGRRGETVMGILSGHVKSCLPGRGVQLLFGVH